MLDPPGSERRVLGLEDLSWRVPRGITPEGRFLASQRELIRAHQNDPYGETHLDKVRCGAAVVVAAAILSGPAPTRRLLDALGPALEARGLGRKLGFVLSIRRRLDEHGELDRRHIAYLQEMTMLAFGRGRQGSEDVDFSAMLAAAGFGLRRVGTTNVREVMAKLAPNEMVGLRYDVSRLGHLVLLGRDAEGQLYIYDSARKSSTFFKHASSGPMFEEYLGKRGAGIAGGVAFSYPSASQRSAG